MGWDDVLAGIGGGLSGINAERVRQDDRKFEREKLVQQGEMQKLREEIKLMLAEMNIGDRQSRHATPSGNVQLQQEGATTRTGMQQTGATERSTARNAVTTRGQDMNYDLGVRRDDTTRRGQDFGQVNFGKTNDRLWEGLRLGDERAQERNWLTERGQNIDVDLGGRRLEGDADSRAMGYALRAYENMVKAKKGDGLGLEEPEDVPTFENWLETSDDPEIFPNVQRMFRRGAAPSGPAAAPAPPPSVMGPPPAAAPAQTPARPPAPGARPVPPGARPAAPAAPGARQPAQAAPDHIVTPSGRRIKVGEPVTLRNGQQVIIKSINPDGSFNY